MRIRGVRRSILDISQFYCNECMAVIPLPRHEGRQKEKGHIKHIYCYKCECRTAHTEKRSFEF